MTQPIDREDWDELVALLHKVETEVTGTAGAGDSGKLEIGRQDLQSFHVTSAMLGLSELEQIGIELEAFVTRMASSGCEQENAALLSFALNALLEQMQERFNGSEVPHIDGREIQDILNSSSCIETAGTLSEDDFPSGVESASAAGASPPPPPEAAPAPEVSESKTNGGVQPVAFAAVEGVPAELEDLRPVVQRLGGDIRLEQVNGGKGELVLRFDMDPAGIARLKTLLSAGDPSAPFAPTLSSPGGRYEKILNIIKDFMVALSEGYIVKAQEIILNLAEQQQQAGLYNEIGSLARELHNSLKCFMDTMDPALKEMVEERLPDSGNRLEHILELTERAANTTIDHVETMQQRIEIEEDIQNRIGKSLNKLTPVGEAALKRVKETLVLLDELQTSTVKNKDDLIVVLTAQDYQDLTGQIILKIMKLLKDLELKLVNVIRTFGMKVEAVGKSVHEDLYGPAHKAKEEALHSQDDVDSLLAEFGF